MAKYRITQCRYYDSQEHRLYPVGSVVDFRPDQKPPRGAVAIEQPKAEEKKPEQSNAQPQPQHNKGRPSDRSPV